MSFDVRPYHPSDLPALYRICHLTAPGTAEGDAPDRDLAGHQYLGAYLALEPGLAFVATARHEPIGYIVGTADTAAFAARCEADWYPVLRERHPIPAADDTSWSAGYARELHDGVSIEPIAASHPAHLHINLLSSGRGGGLGRRLIDRFVSELHELGVDGLHLTVAASNAAAIGFYERLGFRAVASGDDIVVYVRSLGG